MIGRTVILQVVNMRHECMPLVNRDIPPYCVAVGNPCRPVKVWNNKGRAFERAPG